MPRLEYIIRGIKRCTGQQTRTRLPITPALMKNLRNFWRANRNDRDYAMLWAAACMCFFGFMRAGELVVPSDIGFDSSYHLAFGDVLVDSRTAPSYLVVKLKASKTDPFRQGVHIYLGRTDGELCAVGAILSYMVKRGTGDGSFFSFGDGRLLTRDRFVTAVREALPGSPLELTRHTMRGIVLG